MIKKRIENLRTSMKENNIDIYYIPTSDPHKSEYIHNRWKAREYFSGFTGSAGFMLITMDEALLWTDGRYFVQAENQLAGTDIQLMKYGLPETPTIYNWIKDNAKNDAVIGFDPEIVTVTEIENFKEKLNGYNFRDIDLIEINWKNREKSPCSDIYEVDIKYCGESRESKIDKIRNIINSKEADCALITKLDDIAWTLNLRGADIPCNPVFLSYLYIDNDDVILFTAMDRKYPKINNIKIKEYNSIFKYIESKKDRVILVEKRFLNYKVYSVIKDSIKESTNLVAKMKAIKNDIEINNLRKCHDKDSVAMTKFLYWLDTNAQLGEITELEAAERLEAFRAEIDGFIGNSFDYISAFGPNGAMMHYKATKDKHSIIRTNNFYLIDSGGQYMNGTTDITRTLPIGEVSYEMKKDYTLVVKSHIQLAIAKFLYGATGSKLDTIPRSVMWQNGKDYKCGTGHGVGFLLNVHEGPQGMGFKPNNVAIEEGMILTNEPGIYKAGEYGIRIENTVVAKKWIKNADGQFMHFETLSYCPIDVRPIVWEMLSDDEIQWLAEYNEICVKRVSPYLSEDELMWLSKISPFII